MVSYNTAMAPIPMRRNWFYILVSLAEADRHGLGIMRDVLELTDQEVRLWPATLYGTLDELREQGWVRETDAPRAPPEVAEAGNKRWFRITPNGRFALTREVARMEGISRVAKKRLLRVGDTV